MTVTIISVKAVEYIVEWNNPLQLRVKLKATGPFWLMFQLKPEELAYPPVYKWSRGPLEGPFPATQTEVILERYMPDEWTPPADTRWMFQALGAYNEDGGYTVYVQDPSLLRNAFSYGAPLKYALTIRISGSGTSIPTPYPDSHYYDNGTQVTVTAYPSSGWKFDHWGGAASGTSTSISVTMDRDKVVDAYFKEVVTPPPPPPDGEPDGEGEWWEEMAAWLQKHWYVPVIGGVSLAGAIALWPKKKGGGQ